MKKIFLAVCLLCPFIGASQEKYTTFWGLEFGISMEQVKNRIQEERGLTPSEITEETLTYTDCKVAGQNATAVFGFWESDNLYMGKATMPAASMSSASSIFSQIESGLIEKYGNPTYPSDGGKSSTLWRIPDAKNEKFGISISVERINGELFVVVGYVDWETINASIK